MMQDRIYEIEIEEILQKVCSVKAKSLQEAIDIVEEKYDNQEIVLDYNSLKETNYREYKEVPHKSKTNFER